MCVQSFDFPFLKNFQKWQNNQTLAINWTGNGMSMPHKG